MYNYYLYATKNSQETVVKARQSASATATEMLII